jgi:hypothetical protein
MSRVARSSTEAEIDALDAVCERLVGFGIDVSLEWVDGYLTALAASRRAIDASEWLPAMFGDAFERAFADPADVAQALAALTGRWHVLVSQLDPQSLLDEPEDMRLSPRPCDCNCCAIGFWATLSPPCIGRPPVVPGIGVPSCGGLPIGEAAL